MKKAAIIFLVLMSCFVLHAQTDTAYIYTFGGAQNDGCNQIKRTRDKGYIAIGTTNSFGCGNTDFYVIKTDSLCKHQWSKTFGGAFDDEGFSVTPTLDGGYAFVGFTNGYDHGGYDALLIKTDSMGNLQWQKTYGGADWDFGYSVQQLKDSGYIICGLTYSYGAGNGDVFVVRSDKNGDTLWTKAIGGTGYDIGNAVAVEEDSLYAIMGTSTSFGSGDTDAYFILIDDKGIVKKTNSYGSTHNDAGYSINNTIDNGFIVFGSTDSMQSGKPDEMMLKLDSVGNLQWMQIYHSSGISIGKDVIQQPNSGDYYAVSTSNAYGLGGFSLRTWQSAPGGWAITAPSFGGPADEYGNSLAFARNDGIVFAGSSNSAGYTEGLADVYVVRIKSDSLINNYVLSIHNYKDSCGCVLNGVNNPVAIQVGLKVFPNPVSSSATLLVQGTMGEKYSYSIYNAKGQSIIRNLPLESTIHDQFTGYVEKANLLPGEYICKILNQKGIEVATAKFIVE